jgi:DNA-binding response OmpR family regulator
MKTKVLLVDDDEIVLDYLSLFVAAAGYDVVKATNAEAALTSMQQDFAQIVILDISMPGMDGLALCRAIRRQTYSGYVYIVPRRPGRRRGRLPLQRHVKSSDY